MRIFLNNDGVKTFSIQKHELLDQVRHVLRTKHYSKLKTVKLVVEDEPWQLDKDRTPANKLIGLQVFYGETSLGKPIRAVDGRWNRKKKLWELPYRGAVNLGLEERIVER